jgi:hypothetical protein
MKPKLVLVRLGLSALNLGLLALDTQRNPCDGTG